MVCEPLFSLGRCMHLGKSHRCRKYLAIENIVEAFRGVMRAVTEAMQKSSTQVPNPTERAFNHRILVSFWGLRD
eukprot:1042477-Amphidinium_carterae.2